MSDLEILKDLEVGAEKHPFLPVVAVVVFVGVAVSAIMWIPVGTPTRTSGRLVAMGQGSMRGVRPAWATVDLLGRRATLDTYTILDCRIGETIPLKRQRYVWGWRFSAAATRCQHGKQAVAIN